MPQIVFTRKANEDIKRCVRFLEKVAPEKIQAAIQAILQKIAYLNANPHLGGIIEDAGMPELRKLVIGHGKNGYIALYSYDESQQKIIIQSIRHMRELGH